MMLPILDDLVKVEQRRYVSFGDFSVTDLITPPRIVALRNRHGHKVKENAQQILGAMIGVAIHEYVERALRIAAVYNPKYILERTVSDVYTIGDKEVFLTGRFDILYDLKYMVDIKSTSTWKRIFDPGFEDWHKQQNFYATLLHNRGIDVESLKIMAIYKDWLEAQTRDPAYPQSQIEWIDLDLWKWSYSEDMMLDLLQKHVASADLPDDELPECSREDRWERFPGGGTKQYAIMTGPKAKRADKVFKDESWASVIEYITERQAGRIDKKKPLPKGSFVEVRYAQRKRCEKYCKINQFCNHYQTYIEQKRNDNLNEYIPLEVIL